MDKKKLPAPPHNGTSHDWYVYQRDLVLWYGVTELGNDTEWLTYIKRVIGYWKGLVRVVGGVSTQDEGGSQPPIPPKVPPHT